MLDVVRRSGTAPSAETTFVNIHKTGQGGGKVGTEFGSVPTIAAPTGTALYTGTTDLFELGGGAQFGASTNFAGIDASAQAGGDMGTRGTATGTISTDGAQGRVDVGAELALSASAGAQTAGTIGSASAGAQAKVTAQATGTAGGSVTTGGVNVNVGGELFAGVKVGAGAQGELGGGMVSGSAGVEGMAGVGVTGQVGGAFNLNEVGFKVKLGASLGFGGSVSLNVGFSPKKIWGALTSWL
jgi:hypothetical protein